MARDGGGEGAGVGAGIDFLGYELLPSCLLLSYQHSRERAKQSADTRARLHTHVRYAHGARAPAHVCEYAYVCIYARGFARGIHRPPTCRLKHWRRSDSRGFLTFLPDPLLFL